MDTMECIKTRRSVRRYQARAVPQDLIGQLLEAGRWAPTPAGLQLRRFMVVEHAQTIGQLAAATAGQDFVAGAPLVIVVGSNFGAARAALGDLGVPLATQEAAAAVQTMLLAAHALGLSACWVGRIDAAQVGRIVGLAAELTAVAVTCVGYAAEAPELPVRLPVAAITRHCG